MRALLLPRGRRARCDGTHRNARLVQRGRTARDMAKGDATRAWSTAERLDDEPSRDADLPETQRHEDHEDECAYQSNDDIDDFEDSHGASMEPGERLLACPGGPSSGV